MIRYVPLVALFLIAAVNDKCIRSASAQHCYAQQTYAQQSYQPAYVAPVFTPTITVLSLPTFYSVNAVVTQPAVATAAVATPVVSDCAKNTEILMKFAADSREESRQDRAVMLEFMKRGAQQPMTAPPTDKTPQPAPIDIPRLRESGWPNPTAPVEEQLPPPKFSTPIPQPLPKSAMASPHLGVLNNRCAKCHDKSVAATRGDGIVLTDGGREVSLTQPQYVEVAMAIEGGTMPKDGKLSAAEKGNLKTWIMQRVTQVATR